MIAEEQTNKRNGLDVATKIVLVVIALQVAAAVALFVLKDDPAASKTKGLLIGFLYFTGLPILVATCSHIDALRAKKKAEKERARGKRPKE